MGIVSIALILCLRVAGVIGDDVASDTLGRTLGILAILGLATGAIGLATGTKKQPVDRSPDNSGPKF